MAMSIPELLKSYFEIQRQLYDAFGYQEDWVVIPVSDETANYWMLTGDREKQGSVAYSPDPLTRESIEDGGALYSADIYTQRHLPKWVYRTETHTMVCADTRTDGNKFLMIFDNTKECTDHELAELYEETW